MSDRTLRFWQNSRRFTSLVAAVFFLATAVPAYAEYKPKNRKAASGYSRGGGSRGCPGSDIPLTLLAPKTFVGKTAAKRPMLAFYMSDSQNVRFRIFELKANNKREKIGEFTTISAIAGINKLKLPADYPELVVGKTYLWQIATDCEMESILSRAEFTVVNLNQSHAENKFIAIPQDADYYAQNELWYEALETALKTAANGKLSADGSKLIQQLAQLELPGKPGAEANIIQQRTEYLQKISRDNL